MGKKKCLTLSERAKIDVYHQEGLSGRAIGRRIGRGHEAILNYLKDTKSYGSNYKGRVSTALTPQDKRNIFRLASNSALSTTKIGLQAGVNASKSTVRRAILSANHLKRLKLKKKPPLNAERKQKRLEFAKEHMTWNVMQGQRDNDW